APTSSPSMSTDASSAMARASARLTAWTRVISGIAASPTRQVERCLALFGQILRQALVGEIEHRVRALRRRCKISPGSALDRQRDFGEQLLLIRLAPHPGGDEMVAQPGDRLFRPACAHFRAAAIAACIVGRRMITEAISQRLDQMRTAARPRL